MNSARIKPTWPLTALFSAYPLWWLLGITGFVWLIIAIPMIAVMISRRRSRAPIAFVLWLAFTSWVLLSGVQITTGNQILSASYRFALYLMAAVLFLYVYNLPRSGQSNNRILRILTIFWMIVVAGGYAGIILHGLSITPPIDYVLPHGLRNQPFVQELTQPVFAEVQSFLGFPVPRPAAPFAYTNNWGGMMAILTFVAFASIADTDSRRWRRFVLVVLVLSIVPMAFSLNRGMFLSILAGIMYVAVRLAMRRRFRALGTVVALTAVALVVLTVTPLGSLITGSFSSTHGQSNRTRLELYQKAATGAAASPVFGYGGPKFQPGQTTGAEVGTQGQLWVVLYSDGYPALAFFLGFFLAAMWQTRRAPRNAGLCLHAVPLVALAQIVVYGWLPAELQVIMVVLALSYRMCMRPEEVASSRIPQVSSGRQFGSTVAALPRRQPAAAPARQYQPTGSLGTSPAGESQ